MDSCVGWGRRAWFVVSVGLTAHSCGGDDAERQAASSDTDDASDPSMNDASQGVAEGETDSSGANNDAGHGETDGEGDGEPVTTDDQVNPDGGVGTEEAIDGPDAGSGPPDAASSESEPPNAASMPLLGVYGTDPNTGEFRTWIVDAEGHRTELTPNPVPYPHVFELDGRLVLLGQEPTDTGAIRMLFYPIENATVLEPGVREFPANAFRSVAMDYAYQVNILESEQRQFDSGFFDWIQSSELLLFDGLDPAPIVVTENLPPFSTLSFSLPFWSVTGSKLYYPVATNDDVDNPTWEIRAAELEGRELGEPQTVMENAIWPSQSRDGRWLILSTIENPWVAPVYATPRHKWLVEQGTWQRYDLGAEAPNEETTWRFSPNSRWLIGERRDADGIFEVVYKGVPDGEIVSVAKPSGEGSVWINGSHSEGSQIAVRQEDASGAHVRSHYVDLDADEPQNATVEGEHFFWWPGLGDLIVTYVSDPPGAAPSPDTTGMARLYRTSPTPENLLHELELNYWLHASASDDYFVYHTDDGWFSIGAAPDAEPIAIDLGTDMPEMLDARYHPTYPISSVTLFDEQSHVWLVSWPDGEARTTLVEFPEIENTQAYWVVPLPLAPPPLP